MPLQLAPKKESALPPNRPLEASAMYLLIQHYLEQLPGAMKEEQLADGSTVRHCLYTPHSLRATPATLLLDAGVDTVTPMP